MKENKKSSKMKYRKIMRIHFREKGGIEKLREYIFGEKKVMKTMERKH